MKHLLRVVVLGAFALAGLPAQADVPRTIAFQGIVKDAAGKPITSPPEGTPVIFTLYSAENETTPAWSERQTVNAKDGLFAASLGSITSFASAGIVFDKPYWVGVKVGTDTEMRPRTSLQSVPYALALPGLSMDPNGLALYGDQGGTEIVIDSPVSEDYLTAMVGSEGSGLKFSDSNFFFISTQPYANRRDITANVEIMRILSNGNVGIGTTTPGVRLDVNGSIRTAGNLDVAGGIMQRGADLVIIGRGGGDGNNGHAGRALVDLGPGGGLAINYGNDFGGVVVQSGLSIYGGLGVTGSASAQTLTLTSSRRFKRNVQPIENALGLLSQLQGVTYTWDAVHGGRPDIGFIAEDVGRILPQLVSWEANRRDAKGMDYAHLTALMVEGIKEQQEQINDQHRRIANLEAENADLRVRLEQIESLVTDALADAATKERYR